MQHLMKINFHWRDWDGSFNEIVLIVLIKPVSFKSEAGFFIRKCRNIILGYSTAYAVACSYVFILYAHLQTTSLSAACGNNWEKKLCLTKCNAVFIRAVIFQISTPLKNAFYYKIKFRSVVKYFKQNIMV